MWNIRRVFALTQLKGCTNPVNRSAVGDVHQKQLVASSPGYVTG